MVRQCWQQIYPCCVVPIQTDTDPHAVHWREVQRDPAPAFYLGGCSPNSARSAGATGAACQCRRLPPSLGNRTPAVRQRKAQRPAGLAPHRMPAAGFVGGSGGEPVRSNLRRRRAACVWCAWAVLAPAPAILMPSRTLLPTIYYYTNYLRGRAQPLSPRVPLHIDLCTHPGPTN